MYEFDSVSVSSFEAASLAVTLTEKSADGWDVVAVVPAGSDVVAYLRRSTAAASTAAAEDAAAEAAREPAATAPSGETPAIDLLTPAASGSAEPSAAGTAAEAGATGWGTGTDSTAEPAGVGGSQGSTSWGGGTSAGGWSGGGTDSSSWGGSAQQQQPAAAAASAPSVPAGWYADPAGRFELRYWDGNAWTEHVSRAGQQYTDPPVA